MSASMSGRERRWMPGRPVDVTTTLAPLRRGRFDPAHQRRADGYWWAALTPSGPATLQLVVAGGEVLARAWGAGADWQLDRVPVLLGAGDDWDGLDVSAYPGLVRVRRAHPGLRLPSTGLIMDSLVPAILEQKVTGQQARGAWAGLLSGYGEPAPGPFGDGLRVPPPPAVLLQIPTWQWHRWDVDHSRLRTLRAAATVATRLEECAGATYADAARRLRLVPGIGVWTAAETTQRALGDPDAISLNDYHVHNQVVYALTGRPRGTDEEMETLLAPWAGQRQRIVRLIETARIAAPRFGPRVKLTRR
jgi:hypothetical protein